MSERKELLDLIADTKAHLHFLKETGVVEIARISQGEVRNTIARETSMCLISQRGMNNNPLNPPLYKGGDMNHQNPPLVVKGGIGGLFLGSNKAELLSTLREKISNCQQCKLCKGRTNIVFGTGNPDTRLMFVGEGPGEDEDKQGKPFVGKAGELLTKMITAMGINRDDVYIANVVKCRPPGNRNPEGDEITACSPFLKGQIDIIKPEIICTLGTFASHTLLETTIKISDLRGKIHLKDGYKIVPTFHPSYLLRYPGEKARSWQDLQMIMRELGIKTVNSG